jgi:hypothetical protein
MPSVTIKSTLLNVILPSVITLSFEASKYWVGGKQPI